MSELDLNAGDPNRADSASERRKRRRESSSTSASAEAKIDNEIRSQLSRAFDGLLKNRYAAGDQELGDAIADESDAMSEGFVMVTANLPFLRMPLIIILNLLIVLLAFGRVGGILLGRWQDRRARRQAEAQMQDYQPTAEELIVEQ